MINFKNKRGLTLVMLIITILVMVILAGVAISMATGEDGVIKRAEEAVDKNKLAEEEEQIKMTWAELYITQTIITEDDLIGELGSGWNKDGEYIKSPNGNKFDVDEHGNVTVIE